MFSGCLKNIEPEGIKDLRGAKAELLRAKTALEEANAAKVNAEAAFVQAQAKIQEAIAKQEEAKAAYEAAVARLKELEVEKQTALDQIEIEKEIAAAKAEIAMYEKEAAVYAAELERALLLIQTEVLEAQAAYESALKDLAIAKNTLTEEQQKAVAGLEAAVKNARDEVETKTKALEAAAKQLATMLAEVDEAKINKAVFALAERAVVKAQAALEGAKEAEAEAKAALELDPSVTDWEAKVEEYEAEIEKIRSEYYKRNGEVEDAMASMRDSADNVIGLKAEDYTAYTGYEFDEKTGFFSKVYDYYLQDKRFPIGEVVITAPEDEEGTKLFDGDFNHGYTEYYYDREDEVIAVFENRLKQLSTFNAKYHEANIAYYEGMIDAYKEDPYYKYELAKYNDAVAAYAAGDVLPYYAKYEFPYDTDLPEDFGLAVAVKEYNDALAAMEKAVAQFNSEYDKYNPDFNAEYEAACVAKTNAYSAAEIAKAKAYQKAEDDNKYAYNTDVVMLLADGAWTAAQNAYTIAVAEAEAAGGAIQAVMEAFVEGYDEAATDDVAKETYAAYTAALKLIEDAGKTKTAAEAEYNKAVEAYGKVKEAYDKAIAKADEDYEAATDKADADYDKAVAAILAKTPTFDPVYSNNLVAQVEAAQVELQDAVNLMNGVKGYFGSYTSYYAVFELTSGADYTITNIPAFMMDITVGNDGYEQYAMKSTAVADFVDKEYFKNDVIQRIYDDLTKVSVVHYVYNAENYDQEQQITFFTWLVEAENSPLELPSPDEYKESYDYYASYYTPDWVNEMAESVAAENGWRDYRVREISMVPNAYYIDYLYAGYIAEEEEAIANLALLPDFVKAIEAAQAEFEALVVENAEKLAADKAEVEAFYAEYLELEDKYTTELEAIEAKAYVVIARYNAMIEVIASYCMENGNMSVTDVDALVARLQDQYEDALATVIEAEQAVIDAEQAVEDLKAGVVSAADAAQRAYDRAAEELAEAIAKLERAAKALENVVAAIYETGEVPETPQDPETGDGTTEGGDNTTDGGDNAEGGDDTTEGGEGEGGEAEGGEGAE